MLATAPARGTLDLSTNATPADARAGRRAGQIAYGAMAVFLAQLYVAPSDWFPALQPFRLALGLSAIALGCLFVKRLMSNQALFLGWRTFALAIYVAIAVLSPMWSFDKATSLGAAVEIVKHLLFFIALTNTVNSPSRIRTALWIFACAAIVPGLGTYIHYANGELLVEGFRGRWYGVMADPNHDAMALVAAVPLLLALTFNAQRGWQKALALAAVVGCFLGIVATHSRGGTVGLGVGVLTWALLSRRKGLALGAAMVAAVGLLLFAPASFWSRNQTIATYDEDASVHGRMQAWHVAGRSVSEHPFRGIGAQAFLAAWDHYAPLDAGRDRYVAHNLFLEVAAELGLLGLFGLVAFLGAGLWSCWKARKGPLGVEARALLASLVGYVVCQQFSGYSLSWILYALCGFAACIDQWVPRESTESSPAMAPQPAMPILGVLRPGA